MNSMYLGKPSWASHYSWTTQHCRHYSNVNSDINSQSTLKTSIFHEYLQL